MAEGENPAKETYTVTLGMSDKAITAIHLVVLPDDRYPNRGPGRSDNGNIVLTGVKLSAVGGIRPPRPLTIDSAWADFSQESFPIANAIDDNPDSGWAILPQMGKPHEVIFQPSAEIDRRDAWRV